MRFLVVLCFVMLSLGGMAQTSEPELQAEKVWVSAGYGVPNSFVVGTGIHDLLGENLGIDIQVGILDRAGVRFDFFGMYYADDAMQLPPLLSLYAAAGLSVIANDGADFGITSKLGMEYRLKIIDFEPMAAYIELTPRVHLAPATQLSFNASMGVRVHF